MFQRLLAPCWSRKLELQNTIRVQVSMWSKCCMFTQYPLFNATELNILDLKHINVYQHKEICIISWIFGDVVKDSGFSPNPYSSHFLFCSIYSSYLSFMHAFAVCQCLLCLLWLLWLYSFTGVWLCDLSSFPETEVWVCLFFIILDCLLFLF